MSKILRSTIGLLMMFIFVCAGCSNAIKKQSFHEEMASGSDQYIIGPEDVLQIEVWKEKALSGNVPVRMDGKISLPLIYDVQAAGLTPLQLQEALVEKLKDFVESPNVSVTVMEANSFKVYVSGQVRIPGVIRLRTETSLLQIIPMAGGFTDWANPKKILIVRKGKNGEEKRFTVNYKKMVDGEVPAEKLKPGDTVVVP
jgi:polysaccharide export outer membrane protein